MRTRRHCIVSPLENFFSSLRYNSAYSPPFDRYRESTLDLGWWSTFLIDANSSGVIRFARW